MKVILCIFDYSKGYSEKMNRIHQSNTFDTQLIHEITHFYSYLLIIVSSVQSNQVLLHRNKYTFVRRRKPVSRQKCMTNFDLCFVCQARFAYCYSLWNAPAQSTLVESNWKLKFDYFGTSLANCHSLHHTNCEIFTAIATSSN